MRASRRSRRFFIGALGALAPAAAQRASRARADDYTLRLGVSTPQGSLAATVGIRLATTVQRRSHGQLKIEVFPNGQLVSEAEMANGLANGVVDIVIQASSFLTGVLPQFQVFDAPFLLKDAPSAYRLFDGPLGADLFSALETKGMISLGWAVPGFRELETTGKAVATLDDLRGLRIRVPPASVYAATFQALGAIPTAIANTEMLTALTQHTVDGLEIAISAFVQAKYYTVAKYVAMTNHMLSVEPIACSKRKFDALPPDLRTIMREEGRAAAMFMRKLSDEETAKARQSLRTYGVTVTEIQRPAFRRAVEPVYALVQSKVGGDLLDRVVRAAQG